MDCPNEVFFCLFCSISGVLSNNKHTVAMAIRYGCQAVWQWCGIICDATLGKRSFIKKVWSFIKKVSTFIKKLWRVIRRNETITLTETEPIKSTTTRFVCIFMFLLFFSIKTICYHPSDDCCQRHFEDDCRCSMVELSVLFSTQDKTILGCSFDVQWVSVLRHLDHLCMCVCV